MLTAGCWQDQNGKKHAYFILDRVEAGTELGKFLHEVGAHLGLETILTQPQYTALFQSLVTWADKGRAGDQSLEAQIALRALERIEQAGTPADQTKFEAIAYFIEEAVAAGVDPTALNYKTELGRWFRTLWAAFKKALRKLGMKNIDKLTAQHVVDLAYGAARLELAGHWHGSLPAFRRFDSSYMSTGAGDQWYAWGHYVAKRKGVAEHYRKMVERNISTKSLQERMRFDGAPWNDAIDGIKKARIARFVPGKPITTTPQEEALLAVSFSTNYARANKGVKDDLAWAINDALNNLNSNGKRAAYAWLRANKESITVAEPEANLHRVDTNVLPEETMHWDKPLSEQPQEVQNTLEQRVDDWQGRQLITPFGNVPLDGDPTGSEIYARMVAREAGAPQENWQQYAHKSSKAVSMFLDSIGIKAMEHWDEPSRNAGPPVPMLFFDGDPLGVRYNA